MTSIVFIFKAHIDFNQPQWPLAYQTLDREGNLSIIYLLLSSYQEPLWEWYDLEIIFHDMQSLCSFMVEDMLLCYCSESNQTVRWDVYQQNLQEIVILNPLFDFP